jgi:hypothetical protein
MVNAPHLVARARAGARLELGVLVDRWSGGRMSAIEAEPVSTGRLVLVPLRAEHADEMAAVLAAPDLYAFTGGSAPTPQALRARYERMICGSPDPAVSWCNWVIQLRDPGCLTGTVQATITTRDEPIAEVAWGGRKPLARARHRDRSRPRTHQLAHTTIGPDSHRPHPPRPPGIGRCRRRGRARSNRSLARRRNKVAPDGAAVNRVIRGS